MKFLTKLGQVLLQATSIVTGFAPLAKIALPGQSDKIDVISQDLAEIAQAVATMEAIGQALNLPGPQKLQGITPLVAQIILRSALVANHKVANATLFQQGATKIGDGMADILNSLEDKVETISKI
jgi:hypothetical protein